MANVRSHEQSNPSVERRKDSGEGVVKGPVEARQGFRDAPVVWVLGISLALAIVAYVILHLYFIGSFF
jgi:hypothetical protein